jgi:hypothetical protein
MTGNEGVKILTQKPSKVLIIGRRDCHSEPSRYAQGKLREEYRSGAAGKTPTTPRPFAMLRVTKVNSRVTQRDDQGDKREENERHR